MNKKVAIIVIAVVVLALSFGLGFTKLFLEPGEEDFEHAKFEVNGDTAVMTGVISGRTVEDVRNLIEDNPDLKTIVMQDVPGSMDDDANLEASRLIREHGLNTHVPSDGMIQSGGTDFFCAGVERTIEDGAQIGVHSWATEDIGDASQLSKDHEDHKSYIEYYRDMGIPEEFYWFTINAAPGQGMHMMTVGEIEEFGLVTGE